MVAAPAWERALQLLPELLKVLAEASEIRQVLREETGLPVLLGNELQFECSEIRNPILKSGASK